MELLWRACRSSPRNSGGEGLQRRGFLRAGSGDPDGSDHEHRRQRRCDVPATAPRMLWVLMNPRGLSSDHICRPSGMSAAPHSDSPAGKPESLPCVRSQSCQSGTPLCE
ncbi:hypothetical protein ebA5590 [Aromatoleum aromaticum EbN1]|uniref:Uncharacterized protein n=1 Tax=Aromatoleum aromaticum (strain DSM 19018 / LMG 30748 / EbN1) TaxID=76114 RepID=Q5P057_AROAE|nr:hypothetical protein ebA5590 [Aromatoleum aromaticum EbN1]